MAENTQLSDNAQVLPADYTLSKKLDGVSLNKIITPAIVKEAETVIVESADDFYGECLGEVVALLACVEQLKATGASGTVILPKLIHTAFNAKTKAGVAGYDLVLALAASLQVYCEKLPMAELNAKATQIIDWHAQSINMLLSHKIKGDGGDAGKAILAELEKFGSAKAQ